MFNDSKKHLDDAGESYIQHLIFALNVSIKLVVAGVQCFLHALIPGILKKNGSNTIRELYHKINNRD